jgi:hypothetical protein
MKYETAVAALDKYGPISSTQYRWFSLARQLVKQGDAFFTGKWLNDNDKWEWYDAPDILKEGTYEGCTQTKIIAEHNRLMMLIEVWDGDSFDGYPTKRRCEFLVKLNLLPDEITRRILSKLESQAEDDINHQDDEKRRLRIEAQFNSMMDSLTQLDTIVR